MKSVLLIRRLTADLLLVPAVLLMAVGWIGALLLHLGEWLTQQAERVDKGVW